MKQIYKASLGIWTAIKFLFQSYLFLWYREAHGRGRRIFYSKNCDFFSCSSEFLVRQSSTGRSILWPREIMDTSSRRNVNSVFIPRHTDFLCCPGRELSPPAPFGIATSRKAGTWLEVCATWSFPTEISLEVYMTPNRRRSSLQKTEVP